MIISLCSDMPKQCSWSTKVSALWGIYTKFGRGSKSAVQGFKIFFFLGGGETEVPSSIASPIYKEGQSERTFPNSAFLPNFSSFSRFFPRFFPSFSQFSPIFDNFFAVKGGTIQATPLAVPEGGGGFILPGGGVETCNPLTQWPKPVDPVYPAACVK